jgi:hypothetical protein
MVARCTVCSFLGRPGVWSREAAGWDGGRQESRLPQDDGSLVSDKVGAWKVRSPASRG